MSIIFFLSKEGDLCGDDEDLYLVLGARLGRLFEIDSVRDGRDHDFTITEE